FNLLYANSLINTTVKNYLHEMFFVLDSIVGDNEPTSALYNSASSQIISIENTISNDNTLSSNDKNGLLSVASVLRFSGSYWGNYLYNGGTVGGGSAFFEMPSDDGMAVNKQVQAEGNMFTSEPVGLDQNMVSPVVYFQPASPASGPDIIVNNNVYLGHWWKRLFHADGVGAVGGFFGGLIGGGSALISTLFGALGGSVGFAIFGD
ncbi:MAG TPA: hypothetical protein VLD19_17150, partial [Chitinophagaceae bacterium]|nr:hypothetical protein [Chitinophagaceae bacterium]